MSDTSRAYVGHDLTFRRDNVDVVAAVVDGLGILRIFSDFHDFFADLGDFVAIFSLILAIFCPISVFLF
jgi:hypothetical protein